MGYKAGLIQKLKLCWFWLTSPTRKNMLTEICEFCGSTNLIAVKRAQNAEGERRKCTCEIVCMNCKAKCISTQKWSVFRCKDCFWHKGGKCYNRLLDNPDKRPDPECLLWEPINDNREDQNNE